MALTRVALVALGSISIPSSDLRPQALSTSNTKSLIGFNCRRNLVTLYQPSLKRSVFSDGDLASLHPLCSAGNASVDENLNSSSSTVSGAKETKRRGRSKKTDVQKGEIPVARRKKNLEADQSENGVLQVSDGETDNVSNEKPFGVHMFPYPSAVPSQSSLFLFDNISDVSNAVAKHVTGLSVQAIRSQGSFTLVLSGGSLVKALSALAENPHLSNIEWEKWHVFWVDERVVPISHQDSNYNNAKEEFLSRVPIPDDQVHTISTWDDANTAAQGYEHSLRELAKKKILATTTISRRKFPRFDLILLGIGPDGHIASLFPNSAVMAENKRWVVPITKSPKPPPQRISLTVQCINSAAHVMFIVLGASKAEVLQRVFERPALPGALPAQMVQPNEGDLSWFIDKDAASKLAIASWSDPKKFPFFDWSSLNQSKTSIGKATFS
ncbi:unnamed protein product [Sphagnum jensenii]|uniref:Glucosamine/galactosamine-6-phosphate isomerase domain-containing protein n=1 Tax=Sphagnum jensenii TaxID=128206 RepID=A0ABP0VKD8_9BRYO